MKRIEARPWPWHTKHCASLSWTASELCGIVTEVATHNAECAVGQGMPAEVFEIFLQWERLAGDKSFVYAFAGSWTSSISILSESSLKTCLTNVSWMEGATFSVPLMSLLELMNFRWYAPRRQAFASYRSLCTDLKPWRHSLITCNECDAGWRQVLAPDEPLRFTSEAGATGSTFLIGWVASRVWGCLREWWHRPAAIERVWRPFIPG